MDKKFYVYEKQFVFPAFSLQEALTASVRRAQRDTPLFAE